MWFFIIGGVFAAFIAGLFYISARIAKHWFNKKQDGKKSRLVLVLCVGLFLAIAALLAVLLNGTNAMIIMIHLYCFWLICDLIRFLVSKIRGRESKKYLVPLFAVVLCTVYLTYGWISVHKVRRTDYNLSSAKLDEKLVVVHIADSHIGATFDAEGFAAHLDTISQLNPDIVAITGDFVDDSTPAGELREACKALGTLKTKYGVYFVWGNHDRGYSSEKSRGWSADELKKLLIENGVHVLEDEAVLVNDTFYVVGRLDRSDEQRANGRKSASELLSGLDLNRYVIMLDHQPHDFDAEADAGADLVLCGHTHGGQFIPIRYVGELTGEHDLRYGLERRKGTDFVVTSGISNWALRFKTGCFSEYVVITVEPSK